MFVLSVKTNVKQMVAVCGCVAVVVLAMVLAVVLPARQTATVGATRVGDSAERVAYLRSLGYAVTVESEQVQEVRVPEQPDETVLQYNALQQTAGRSLEPYYGKRVRLYTYDVPNEQMGGVSQVHLYVYRDRVIAGDITTDGAMKPIG